MSEASTNGLEANELLAAASAEAGLDDFGQTAFIEPLKKLLESVAQEGRLVPAGVIGLQMDVIRHLVNRLRFVDELKRHPEILDDDLSDPIVIIGLPRTGTTKLQRMMAQNPAIQSLPLWRALNAAPLPGWQRNEADSRIDIARGFVDILRQQAPDFLAAHPMHAEEAEEEMFLQLGAFDGPAAYGMFFRAPSYVTWLKNRPRDRSYRYLRELLQYLQWQDGGRRNRPWVLKTPLHLGHLDAIVEAFPKATLVHCHRDLEIGMASICRLIEVARITRGSDPVDPLELGEYLLPFWAAEWDANIAQRSSLPTSAKIVDIHFDEIVRDPLAVIRKIHELHAVQLSAVAIDNMRRWETRNPPHQLGQHSYTLERYGITRSDIRKSFAGYYRKFPDSTV